ncbi:hypothetical protein [Christiangramia sediminis]|uniref:Lipoprotein n=1 Tax=Christiangramia sediminis TaxID=2881336 RepID=A0A9X1LIS7_9FLAO|nr:hypothetical protein [Christiangramia sediminis]MCB7481108.1 hypothetical protein [Christiangramia sediminis]
MRIPVIILCLFFFVTACNDSKKKNQPENPASQNESLEKKDQLNTLDKDQDTTNSPVEESSEGEDPEEDNQNTSVALSGLYIKSDHQEDSNCKCYCIDVKLNSTSELCLTEDNLYIKSRFEKSGNNINLYYAGKSSSNSDTKIPWDKFETGTPIAVLSPAGNGFKLDWKGFSIDGEIAIDYALYGKKTLEGTYKKK